MSQNANYYLEGLAVFPFKSLNEKLTACFILQKGLIYFFLKNFPKGLLKSS